MTEAELRGIIAARIRESAKRRGLALNVIADRAGVARSQMFRVLKGETGVTVGWLLKIATVLNVEPSELIEKHDDDTEGNSDISTLLAVLQKMHGD